MIRLRAALAALAALLLIFAVDVPGGSGLPALHGTAQYGLLTAGDGALSAPERATWKRSQGEGREGDPDDEAATDHAPFPDIGAEAPWPRLSVGRSHGGRTIAPHARGPPGPVA